jgi:uncharacterized protein
VKRTSLLLRTSLALSIAFVGARAQENSKTEKIEELLKLTNAEAMSQQMYGQIRAMTTRQIDTMGVSEESKAAAARMIDKLMTELQDRLSWAKMKPEYVRLYDEVYSDEEITGILAFYKSAAGQAFVKKMPLLITKSMEMTQRQMHDLMPELQRITKEAAEKNKSGEPKK